MARRGRRREEIAQAEAMVQPPWRQLRNPHPPVTVLHDEDLEKIHDASVTILEDVGLRILDDETRQILEKAGFRHDPSEQMIRFDREGVMELVAQAPATTTVRGYNPETRLEMGNGAVIFSALGGAPFMSDLDNGRRPGTLKDHEDLLKLGQMFNILHMTGGASVEPQDVPVPIRHLEFFLKCALTTDKSWKPSGPGGERARDALAMARILHQTDDEGLAADPVFYINTNINSPLVLDAEIAQSVIIHARAGQPINFSPFTLAGAMAPATLAGALALQNAETLAGCALVQAVHPGCPYVYGSFTSNVDMKTGSPAFGTPEYTLAAQASGQLARHYNLPWRSSNVNASPAPDAQSAYESQMALWGALTGHVSLLNHACGWLEGGLVASMEKFIIDVEMLQMMGEWMQPIEVSNDTLGLHAVKDVGPGGHYFETEHTLERYKTAFYEPLLSDWSNFENWQDAGSNDATMRANRIWKDVLANYEAPKIDEGIADELRDFVERRKREVGIDYKASA